MCFSNRKTTLLHVSTTSSNLSKQETVQFVTTSVCKLLVKAADTQPDSAGLGGRHFFAHAQTEVNCAVQKEIPSAGLNSWPLRYKSSLLPPWPLMQALGSKVLFEYSHLAARDIPIPIAQAVFYASIPCARKVSRIARTKVCLVWKGRLALSWKLSKSMAKTRVRRGTPTVPRERTARNWLQLVKSSQRDFLELSRALQQKAIKALAHGFIRHFENAALE